MVNNLWPYKPSPAAALVFVVLFALATIWHLAVVFRRRVWYFIPLVIGGTFETVGYVMRYLATGDDTDILLYVLQSLFILVAPALFAASVYMTLGRLIVLLQAEVYSPIRPSWLTKIFVGGDILSFLIQIAGSSFLSSNFNLGKVIIILGLAAQLVSFGLFLAGAVVFHRRLARNPTPISRRLNDRNSMRWEGVMCLLYLAGGVIFIRSVFRLVEFTGSNTSAPMTTEAYLYVCDSSLMFLVLAVLGYFHPAAYVNTQDSKWYQGHELR